MYTPYTIPIESKEYPCIIPVFIEVAQGTRNKYEYDINTGFLKLDRVLHSAVFYPYNYGFIPQTICDDGDPLDILVMGTSALLPGSIANVRPICYMVMEDEKGIDEKVLGVLADDPHYSNIKNISDISEHKLLEIRQFFETYKALEKDKWVRIGGWKGKEETYKLIIKTHQAFMD